MQWVQETNQLIDELATLLEPQGFIWSAPKSQFRCEKKYGFNNFVISFSGYSDGVMVEGHCGVHLHAVEEMIAPFLNTLGNQGLDSHTIICSTAKLKQQPRDRFLIQCRETAEQAATSMSRTIHDHGESFWARYASLNTLDELFNSPSEQTHRLINNVPQALMRGLVIAKLLEREDFENLVNEHRVHLQKIHTNPLLSQRFEELAVSLRGNWLH